MADVLKHIDLASFPKLKPTEYFSPFRYPGGKAFLTGYLADVINALPRSFSTNYVEPFCGGAGAALALLGQGKVEIVYLNDRDPRIFSAWKAILDENERFLNMLQDTAVTIDTWRNYRDLLKNYDGGYSFEVGFATYFINRTSRSGIVLGSGPIGGYDQKGEWKIDARYYKETMERRVRWIGTQASNIVLSNEDGLAFLERCSSELDGRSSLYFVDPPYVKAGSRLYLNAMNQQLHYQLAKFLKSGACHHWVLTYDNAPLIRKLYAGREIASLSVNYSLRKTRKENELLVR